MAIHNIAHDDPMPSPLVNGDVYNFLEGVHHGRAIDTTGFDGPEFYFHPNATMTDQVDLPRGGSDWVVHSGNVWKLSSAVARSTFQDHPAVEEMQAGYLNRGVILATSTDSGDSYTMFAHCETLLDVTQAGDFYIDEDFFGVNLHQVYMYSASDPNSAYTNIVLSGEEQKVIYGSGDNVIIGRMSGTGLPLKTHKAKFQLYSPRAQRGVVHNQGGDGWIIGGIDFCYNAGNGWKTEGNNCQIVSCHTHHNGHNGFGHGGETANDITANLLIRDCEISYNNQSKHKQTWEAGGFKISYATDTVIMGCYSHHNHGVGGWTDVDVRQTTVMNNIFAHNDRLGWNTEISAGDYIAFNYFVDNGSAGVTEGWQRGAQLYIQNARSCVIHNNTIVLSEANVNGDGITLVQQNRGSNAFPTQSFIDGQEWKCQENRIYGNTFYYGCASDAQRAIVEWQADYDEANFTTKNLSDYNTFHIKTVDTGDLYDIDGTSGNRIADISATGFEVNSTEVVHTDVSTFPQWTDHYGNSWDWDEMPDWFDGTGDKYNALPYADKLACLPGLFRHYPLNETSGTVVQDQSFWGQDGEYFNVGTGTILNTEDGIDGNKAVQFVAASSGYADVYDDETGGGQFESLWYDNNHHTWFAWVRRDSAWDASKYIWGAGGDSTAPNSTHKVRGTASDTLEWEWAHNGVKNTDTLPSQTGTGTWQLLLGTYSVMEGILRLFVDDMITPFDVHTTNLIFDDWLAQNYSGTERVRLNASSHSSTPGDYGDHTMQYFTILNGALPQYIRDEIIYKASVHPDVTPIADRNDDENSAITPFSVSATSAGTLTYTAIGLPSGTVALNASTGEFTGTPDTVGIYYVQVDVTNDESPARTTSTYFTWTVDAVTTQAITPDSIAPTSSVGSPTIQVGAVTLTPDSIASTASVGSPTITQFSDNQEITPDGIASTTSVGDVSITVGAVTIMPDSIASTTDLGRPRIVGGEQTTPVISTVISGLSAYPAMTGNLNTILVNSNQYPEGVNMALDVTLEELATKAFDVTEDVAVALVGEADGRFTQAQVDGAVGAMIGVERQDILFLINGDDPSSDVDSFIGLRKKHGEDPWLLFKNENLDNLRVIAAAGTSRLTVVLLQEI